METDIGRSVSLRFETIIIISLLLQPKQDASLVYYLSKKTSYQNVAG